MKELRCSDFGVRRTDIAEAHLGGVLGVTVYIQVAQASKNTEGLVWNGGDLVQVSITFASSARYFGTLRALIAAFIWDSV